MEIAAISLRSGSLTLGLVPDAGGSVAYFRLDQFDLFRPLSPPAGTRPHALHAGMFPMLPFANCIRDNQFVFEGRHYHVASNLAGGRLNYHGSGWQLPWKEVRVGRDSAELRLESGDLDPVYRYRASQHFTLFPDGLETRLVLMNVGANRMPFSFGLHPWFPRHGRALVRFGATARWLEDSQGHASQRVELHEEDSYAAFHEPPRTYWNTCYAGWDGRAEIIWPDRFIRLRLQADPVMEHLMMHVPKQQPGVFCLEPQTSAPCGFDGLDEGRVSSGVLLLDAGESISAAVRFYVETSKAVLQVDGRQVNSVPAADC